VNRTTVTVHPRDARFGIFEEGGFDVKRYYLAVPAATLKRGVNTLAFRVQNNKVSIGYKVISLNFLDATGTTGRSVLPFATTALGADQVADVTPEMIAAGKALWDQKSLLKTSPQNSAIMKASCSMCHVASGLDLQYFGYSNKSIQTRAQFHGLTAEQGQQITAYIRDLKSSAGIEVASTPWNPVYQPGPGLDARPSKLWAAGVGIEGVLDENPNEFLKAIFPSTGGVPNAADIASNKTLNVREIPIAFPLPSWHEWLPTVHPTDAFGATFDASLMRWRYDGRAPVPAGVGSNAIHFQHLKDKGPAYLRTPDGARELNGAANNFVGGDEVALFADGNYFQDGTPSNIQNEKVISAKHWALVKLFEVFQGNNLEEGLLRTYIDDRKARGDLDSRMTRVMDTRGWLGPNAFFASPPVNYQFADSNTVGSATLRSFTNVNRLRTGWYHLALILNPTSPGGNNPIDAGYNNAILSGDLQRTSAYSELAFPLIFNIKYLQQTDNGLPPGQFYGLDGASPWYQADGFGPFCRSAYLWGSPGKIDNYPDSVNAATRKAILNAYLRAWLEYARKWTPQNYYSAVWDGAPPISASLTAFDYSINDQPNKTAISILFCQSQGADPLLTDGLRDFAKSLWPKIDWYRLPLQSNWYGNGPNGMPLPPR
jgi:hypothetical protein